MTASSEIELKFLCAPDDLGAVLAAAPAGDDESKELIAVYFDTPDQALQKAGASLRVRESNGRRIQTLKRGDGLAREEFEAPVETDRPDPDVGPLREMLDGRAAELKPAFNVRVTRRQRLVHYAGAQIELALDQGEVRGGRRASPISEVELELKSGSPQALFGLARELAHAVPLYLSFDTKAARGQALVAGAPLLARHKNGVQLKKGGAVADAFQAIARNALAQISANAAVLRERPDPEAVHQLRVAARTLRSALSTFRKVVTDAEYETIKGELRWLAHACDRARNLDVFAVETLEPAKGWEAPPTGVGELERAVASAREQARSEVAASVGSERFRALMIDAAAWVETGAWLGEEAGRESAHAFAARALDKRRRRLLKDARRLAEISDEDRHRVRIDAKKLRYAAEAFASLYPPKRARAFIRALKALQDELGALNDLATAEPLMASLELERDAAFGAGELVGRKAAAKPQYIADAASAVRDLADADPFWA